LSGLSSHGSTSKNMAIDDEEEEEGEAIGGKEKEGTITSGKTSAISFVNVSIRQTLSLELHLNSAFQTTWLKHNLLRTFSQ